ncbi:MAG: hypothetical protein K2I76_00325 [Malacoplasma sp.]|nr:hypothetical protein [Malacoplasma sp.]MDE5841812.1 hypothetical protein [Malacoplasma sp.]MDE6082499.1 hypothetical protein [Malacoplasma sp.]MDE6562985.1 hypothetical protein [Malacoplasma sp.]
MGRRNRRERKSGNFFLNFIFQLIFTLVFLVITIIVTLITISYLGVQTNGGIDHARQVGWEWATKIPGVQDLSNYINNAGSQSSLKNIGAIVFLFGLDVFCIYFTIMFVIKKIPIIGKIIKWLTGIIPGISVLAIIIGAVILWAI